MIEKVRNKLKKYEIIVLCYDRLKEFYYKWLVSEKQIIKRNFRKALDRHVDLENPIKYNDKIQWLKLNWHDPLATKCADKYSVREFVKEKIGEKYLNEIIDVFESVEEIDIDKLPEKFVLKGTHGSGYNIICKNKANINWKDEFKKIRRWLRQNYYYRSGEWVYKDIKPRIICEKFLTDDDNNSLKDYKIHCFNGKPKFIQVDFDRHEEHKKNLYDLEWNFIDIEFNYPNDKNMHIKMPEKLSELLKLSEKLSHPFPYARVDFYVVKDHIIFGEITFFPANGMGYFKPEKFEMTIGRWLELPNNY